MNVIRSSEFRGRSSERGVTMIIIALAMVSLLAMAALAIDVTTLYVAQGEAQNAADAAALAGAKMFATSGFTSVQAGAPPPIVQNDVCQSSGPGSTAAANKQAEAAAAQNKVVGQPAAIQTVACDFSQPANPRITVTIQRTALPTFFARVLNRTSSTVTASATAEAYNASGSAVQIEMSGVKPWLVPNCPPSNTGAPNANCPGNFFYVDAANGNIANTGSFVGQMITLSRVTGGNTPAADNFYAMSVPITPDAPVCPSTNPVECDDVGTDPYHDNIACSSRYKFSCGQTVGPGQDVTVFTTTGYGVVTRQGTRCLIHASGDDSVNRGQDQFDGIGSVPVTITGGANNPNAALRSTRNISRSDSVVTVPIYDGRKLCFTSGGVTTCNQNATIVGFLQLGITETLTGPSRLRGVIVNAIGCNPGAGGNPISSGVAPIPVRLIHN